MKKRRLLFINILLVINVILALCLFASSLAAKADPEKYWWLAMTGLGFPALLFANLIFVLLWAILWRRYIFISLVAILAGWTSVDSLLPGSVFGKPPNAPPGAIRVMSYNVHHFYGNSKGSTLSIPEIRERMTGFISGRQADIVCIQEFYAVGEDHNGALNRFAISIGFDNHYFRNYRDFWNKKKIVAIATFTRYPVIDTGYFRIDEGVLFGIYTDLLIGQDTVRVYNLHLESNRFGDDDYSFMSSLTDPKKETTNITNNSKRMLWKIRRGFVTRARQVRQLMAHIKSCPYPVIVTGDLNETPASYVYHKLTDDLSDAYSETGTNFFENTFSGQLPFFRIDYILYSDDFSALNYEKIDVDLSDHFPITTSFTIIR